MIDFSDKYHLKCRNVLYYMFRPKIVVTCLQVWYDIVFLPFLRWAHHLLVPFVRQVKYPYTKEDVLYTANVDRARFIFPSCHGPCRDS